MNKLYGDTKDGKILALILEPGNIHRMIEERKPIELKLNEGPFASGLPAKLTLTIMYSETPVHDAREIEKLLGAGKFQDQRTPVTLTKKPHCTECKAVIEQLMVWREEGSPWVVCCANCGAAFGVCNPMEIKGETVKVK